MATAKTRARVRQHAARVDDILMEFIDIMPFAYDLEARRQLGPTMHDRMAPPPGYGKRSRRKRIVEIPRGEK